MESLMLRLGLKSPPIKAVETPPEPVKVAVPARPERKAVPRPPAVEEPAIDVPSIKTQRLLANVFVRQVERASERVGGAFKSKQEWKLYFAQHRPSAHTRAHLRPWDSLPTRYRKGKGET
jgi:hypothetical protein